MERIYLIINNFNLFIYLSRIYKFSYIILQYNQRERGKQIMKKFKRFLKFQNLKMIVYNQHPKAISRVYLNIIDIHNNSKLYKTLQYGHIDPTTIIWDQILQIPFQSQPYLHFQTTCQHQYGYQLEQLKGFYNGKININADQFFFENMAKCYSNKNNNKIQCGKLIFMIKIIQKQIQNENKEEHQVIAPVNINLRVRIQLNTAILAIFSHYQTSFYRKKYRRLNLQIIYGNYKFQGKLVSNKDEYKWSIKEKFDVNNESSDSVFIIVLQNDNKLLEGNLSIDTLQKGRRFTVHQVILSTINNHQKIGLLYVDLRCLTKAQILDLIYSPVKLTLKKPLKQPEQKIIVRTNNPLKYSAAQIKKQHKISELLYKLKPPKKILKIKDEEQTIRSRFLSQLKQQIKGQNIDKYRRSQQKYNNNNKDYKIYMNLSNSTQLRKYNKNNHQLPKI